jgi:hypothetical protein
MTQKTTLVTLTYGDRFNFLHTLVSRSLESPLIDRVIIVSNASTSPLETLRKTWPDQVSVIYMHHNSGSARGYSVGIQAALDAGAEHIWLMDDDNAPTINAIATLHQVLEERKLIDGEDKATALQLLRLSYRAAALQDLAPPAMGRTAGLAHQVADGATAIRDLRRFAGSPQPVSQDRPAARCADALRR